jgi:O-acetylserine/cysteine efflux transporter
MNRAILPYLAFAACAAIWSSTFLAIRIGNDSFPALWACSLRLVFASLALNVILVLTRQRWPTGAALKAACWYGVLEFGVGLPLLYWGEKVVNSGLAAVVYAISPIAAMIAAKIFGTETLSMPRLGAAVFAVVGVGIIFWQQIVAGGSAMGLLVITVAACAGSMAAVLLQRGPKQSSIGANAVGAVIAIPFSFLASFAFDRSHPLPTKMEQIFPIFYLAIASSVVAFGLFAWLVNHWRVSTVSFLGVIVPVMAVGLGVVFRQESIAPGALLGAVVVIASVAVAVRFQIASSPAA